MRAGTAVSGTPVSPDCSATRCNSRAVAGDGGADGAGEADRADGPDGADGALVACPAGRARATTSAVAGCEPGARL
ncbi:CotH kinase family protein, partial [Kitasatospora sp. NPDC054769]